MSPWKRLFKLALVASFVMMLVPGLKMGVREVTHPIAEARAVVHPIYGEKDAEPEKANASGVLVAEGWLLTAQHVAQHIVDGGKLYVGAERIEAQLVRMDTEADIALLYVPGLKCPCARVDPTIQLEQDEKLLAVGYPLARGQHATEGRFEHTAGKFSLMALTIAPGNSGGGIFVWRRNHWYLTGIASAVAVFCLVPPDMFTPGMCQTMNYLSQATNVEELHKFLAKGLQFDQAEQWSGHLDDR